MCQLLESVRKEAKKKGLNPQQVICMIHGIESICDGTTCISLEVTEPMDYDTLQALGRANLDRFYQKLENHQALVRH